VRGTEAPPKYSRKSIVPWNSENKSSARLQENLNEPERNYFSACTTNFVLAFKGRKLIFATN